MLEKGLRAVSLLVSIYLPFHNVHSSVRSSAVQDSLLGEGALLKFNALRPEYEVFGEEVAKNPVRANGTWAGIEKAPKGREKLARGPSPGNRVRKNAEPRRGDRPFRLAFSNADVWFSVAPPGLDCNLPTRPGAHAPG